MHKSSDRQQHGSQPFSSLSYENQVDHSHVWAGIYFLLILLDNKLNFIIDCNFSHPAYLKQCLGGPFGWSAGVVTALWSADSAHMASTVALQRLWSAKLSS
ncbi:hypothetical protein AYI69_g777 [Smittium culicis]|uniref:Uncharacterized protein n=1 Tax=Smittium culicis TaxID=133412 RepID=A0A1R1YS69_9FUNG|nr:hypothetical protein AYI69_g777 [Smittium culicis]